MVDAFHLNLLCFTNVTPYLGSRESLVLFISEPLQASFPTSSPLGLNLASVYLNMNWRLDSPGSITLTIHLYMRLVLVAFGSTNPILPFFFHATFLLTNYSTGELLFSKA